MPGESGGTPQRSIRGFWNAHKKDPPTEEERKAERAAAEARQRKIAQEKVLAAEKAKELGFHDFKKHKGGGRPTFDSIWKQGSQSYIQERYAPPTRYETECPKSQTTLPPLDLPGTGAHATGKTACHVCQGVGHVPHD